MQKASYLNSIRRLLDDIEMKQKPEYKPLIWSRTMAVNHCWGDVDNENLRINTCLQRD